MSSIGNNHQSGKSKVELFGHIGAKSVLLFSVKDTWRDIWRINHWKQGSKLKNIYSTGNYFQGIVSWACLKFSLFFFWFFYGDPPTPECLQTRFFDLNSRVAAEFDIYLNFLFWLFYPMAPLCSYLKYENFSFPINLILLVRGLPMGTERTTPTKLI